MRQRAPRAGVKRQPAPPGTVAVSALVAGVDEAGRGPLAGPVVVAASGLQRLGIVQAVDPRLRRIEHHRRDELYDRIVERALAW